MDKRFFTWETWDIIDATSISFHDVTLTTDVEEHKAGKQFKHGWFDFTSGILVLSNFLPDGSIEESFCYELTLAM